MLKLILWHKVRLTDYIIEIVSIFELEKDIFHQMIEQTTQMEISIETIFEQKK